MKRHFGKSHGYSDKFKSMIIEKYLNGMSSVAIEKKWPCTRHTVTEWVKEKYGKEFIRSRIKNVKYLKKLTESEKAYIAGFFDGEGSVLIQYNKLQHRCFLQLVVANTYKANIEYLKEKLGGSFSEHEWPKKFNYKKTWYWRVSSHQAEAILKCLLPYLKIKYRQAKLVLKFRQEKNKGLKHWLKVKKELSVFNRRGRTK